MPKSKTVILQGRVEMSGGERSEIAGGDVSQRARLVLHQPPFGVARLIVLRVHRYQLALSQRQLILRIIRIKVELRHVELNSFNFYIDHDI